MGTFNTTRFSYDEKTNTFCAEISELGPNVFEQIYPDAADGGLVLISQWSGFEAKFVIYQTDTNDGDLLCWHLHATKESVKQNPKLENIRVIIFND